MVRGVKREGRRETENQSSNRVGRNSLACNLSCRYCYINVVLDTCLYDHRLIGSCSSYRCQLKLQPLECASGGRWHGKHPGIVAFVGGVTAAAVGALAGAVIVIAQRSTTGWATDTLAVVTAVLLWWLRLRCPACCFTP